jgi:lipopolysaccharide/colanic/teichoic acid biosynthesis glycosyltransferase
MTEVYRFDSTPSLSFSRKDDGVGNELSASANAQRVEPHSYLSARAFFDSVISIALFFLVVPIYVIIGTVLLLDVGSPVLFRQHRTGHNGRTFLIRKFRTQTIHSDDTGWADANRLESPDPDVSRPNVSSFGSFLRKTRLDELPQLLNVMSGDMALIGPRPLLPHDQPPNPAIRLSVRPGITGWAQVHGGTLLTALEKRALDEWYVHHASITVDLQIIIMTLPFMIRGERRCEPAIAAASAFYARHTDRDIDTPILEPSMS